MTELTCKHCHEPYTFEDLGCVRIHGEPQPTRNYCGECASLVEKWHRICPPMYRESDPARVPQEQLRKVLAWQHGPRGLLLHGPTGKCKTRCAWLRLHRLHFDEKRSLVAFDAVNFSHAVAKHFGPDGDAERWLSNVHTAHVLFFDDLGKCRLTERGEAELFGIVENRMVNCRPIIATTNFVGETLADNFRDDVGRALVRRLRECCECIAF